MYQKIGFIDDGSKNASLALKTLVRFAKSQGISFTIIGVMDILTPMKPFFATGGEKWNEEIDIFRKSFSQERARIKKILVEDEKYARANGITPAVVFLEGEPADQVRTQAHKYQVLFVGGYAKSRKKLENIASKLAREAKSDLFVARKDNVKEILLALRGDSLDRAVIEKGILFAKSFGANVTAVHYSGTLSGGPDGSSIVKKAKEAGQAAGIKVRGVLASGRVSSKMLSHAEKSDLVVLGTKGVEGLGDMLFGSYAEGFANKSPCSTLIIRPQKKRRE